MCRTFLHLRKYLGVHLSVVSVDNHQDDMVMAGSSLALEGTGSLPVSASPVCGESHVVTAALSPQSWALWACGSVGVFSKQSSSLYMCAMDSENCECPILFVHSCNFFKFGSSNNKTDYLLQTTAPPVLLREWGTKNVIGMCGLTWQDIPKTYHSDCIYWNRKHLRTQSVRVVLLYTILFLN